jgi:hypothetical protein
MHTRIDPGKGIPVLTKENFLSFRFRILNAWTSIGISPKWLSFKQEVLDRVAVKLEPMTDKDGKPIEKKEEVNRQEEQAKQEELAKLQPDPKIILQGWTILIQNIPTQFEFLVRDIESGDLRKAWQAVAGHFKTNTRRSTNKQLVSFFNNKLQKGKPFSRWSNELRTKQKEINELFEEQAITETHMLSVLLVGLLEKYHDRYNTVVTILEQQGELTFDKCVEVILPVANREERRGGDNSIDEALATKTEYITSRLKNPKLMACFNMANTGDCKFKEKCRFSHDPTVIGAFKASPRFDKSYSKGNGSRSSSSSSSSNSNSIRDNRSPAQVEEKKRRNNICSYCGKGKHFSRDCRQRKADHESEQKALMTKLATMSIRKKKKKKISQETLMTMADNDDTHNNRNGDEQEYEFAFSTTHSQPSWTKLMVATSLFVLSFFWLVLSPNVDSGLIQEVFRPISVSLEDSGPFGPISVSLEDLGSHRPFSDDGPKI